MGTKVVKPVYIAAGIDLQQEIREDHLRRIQYEIDQHYMYTTPAVASLGSRTALVELAERFYGDCPEVREMKRDLTV